jgi:hypothetical protein
MAFRYNPRGGEMVGYAVADSFGGPFTALSNLSARRGAAGQRGPFRVRAPASGQQQQQQQQRAAGGGGGSGCCT